MHTQSMIKKVSTFIKLGNHTNLSIGLVVAAGLAIASYALIVSLAASKDSQLPAAAGAHSSLSRPQ